jgi:hypothetical protein
MALRWGLHGYGFADEYNPFAVAYVEQIDAREYMLRVRVAGSTMPLISDRLLHTQLGPFKTEEEARAVAEVVFRMEG